MHQKDFDFEAMASVLPHLLQTGLSNTLIISMWATVLGTALGPLLAIMRISLQPKRRNTPPN